MIYGSGDEGYAVVGSGALVAPRIVLTACHVVAEEVSHVVFDGLDVGSVGAGRVFGVQRTLPDASDPGVPGLDVGVLILEQPHPAPLTARAWPELYDEVLAGNVEVFVAGYGKTETGSSGRKRGGTFLAAANPDWVDYAATDFQEGREIVLINTRQTSRVETAKGDSGGPVYFPDRERGFALGGITSRGVTPLDLRYDGIAGGVYVRLDAVEPWLDRLREQYP